MEPFFKARGPLGISQCQGEPTLPSWASWAGRPSGCIFLADALLSTWRTPWPWRPAGPTQGPSSQSQGSGSHKLRDTHNQVAVSEAGSGETRGMLMQDRPPTGLEGTHGVRGGTNQAGDGQGQRGAPWGA